MNLKERVEKLDGRGCDNVYRNKNDDHSGNRVNDYKLQMDWNYDIDHGVDI